MSKPNFDSRFMLIEQVKKLAPWCDDYSVSPIQGGRKAALEKLLLIDPKSYASSRNYLEGSVTRLSPYINHGSLQPKEILDQIMKSGERFSDAEKLLQELTWREFWQYVLDGHPKWLWQDVEPYKTGFTPDDYADELPHDIATGTTGVAVIDQFAKELANTGYLHNHARMYISAYVVHWRKVKWQAGARWFLHHLLDANCASNNLSWQWVASTFSHKPYFFNLDNVRKYAGDNYDVSSENNTCLDGSYDSLSKQLFPYGVQS